VDPKRAIRRRRRIALGALAGLAAGAFALGAAMGDGPPPQPSLASRLSIPRLAGERIVTGFEGTTVPASLSRSIRVGEVAGVILFADNLPDRATARRLTTTLQSIRRPAGLRDPLLVMVDQEGGQVVRVSGAPTVSAAAMGARGGVFSRAQGERTAANLRNLGIGVDLAPVLDVARPGGVIAATERGFDGSAATVAATAVPFAEGLQSGGVAATAKHFPGLGAAAENTDFAVQRIGLSQEQLRRIDETPYRAFVAAGGEMVMLSTAIYPALSPRPAAFARAIATGELRGRIGFEGVSITDALETVAVRRFGGPPRAALAAARAGTDLLLFTDPGEARQGWRALVLGLRSGALDRQEFEDSANRVLELRESLGAG
jgi:beta-N-acetylhexosaminidase